MAEPVFESWLVGESEIGVIVTTYNGLGLFEFPRGTRLGYLTGTKLVFGCLRGFDTLVSEFGAWPLVGDWTNESSSFEPIRTASDRRSSPFYDPTAVADIEVTTVTVDTSLGDLRSWSYDEIERRSHLPIGLEVRETVHSWSGTYLRRLILVDYHIHNISRFPIHDGTVGIAVDPNVHWVPEDIGFLYWPPPGAKYYYTTNDLTGFLTHAPGLYPKTVEPIDLAWYADNDGDPVGDPSVFSDRSPTGVMGVRVLRRPSGARLNFNWWAALSGAGWDYYVNWGPRRRANQSGYHGSRGYPPGDRSIYRMMTNGEIDPDQLRVLAPELEIAGWSPPPDEPIGSDIANGHYIYSLLSVGPLDPIAPGDSTQFTVAFIAGADFHRYPDNFARNFDPYNPQPYLDKLDFSDLIKNARWAAWVYDNPGVDTDGDGYRGEAHLINCVDGRCDSVFYSGDGVPDWRGPGPPESSPFELSSGPGTITLRWSGEYSELQVDPLSGQRDFEGFRVYTGRFERDDQYSLIASWDVEDFKRFAWIPKEGKWLQISHPATIPAWQEMLNNPDFDPADYATPSFDLAYRDTVLDTTLSATGLIIRIDQRERYSYWQREDYNRGNEYDDNGQWVQNAIQRVVVRDTVIGEDTLSYGVYEITIDHLNPAVPLYFSVTAFDFGNYEVDLEPLESSPSNNSQYAHPIYSSDVVIDSGLRVSVYPNPYKVIYDGPSGDRTTYYQEGYEGRGIYKFEEQDRRIWFVNLPEKATIRIFSLDGDLIRAINHPDPFLTKYPSAVGWDLVSRNIQAVTSGIYIWRVDSELGTQTGKLVIIK